MLGLFHGTHLFVVILFPCRKGFFAARLLLHGTHLYRLNFSHKTRGRRYLLPAGIRRRGFTFSSRLQRAPLRSRRVTSFYTANPPGRLYFYTMGLTLLSFQSSGFGIPNPVSERKTVIASPPSRRFCLRYQTVTLSMINAGRKAPCFYHAPTASTVGQKGHCSYSVVFWKAAASRIRSDFS